MTSIKRAKLITGILFMTPSLVIYSLYMIIPVPYALYLSFFRWNGISPKILVEISNWGRILVDSVFRKSLLNSIYIGVACIFLQVPLGLFIALLLVAKHLKGKKVFQTVYVIPLLLSAVAVGILWKFYLDPTFGVVNNFLLTVGLPNLRRPWLGDTSTALFAVIVVEVWQFAPLYMLIFGAALSEVPQHLYEAAVIDGASSLECFWHITIPLIRGVYITATTIALVGSIKMFDLVWVMTEGGPSRATELMATYMYKQTFHRLEFGYGATIGVALFGIAFGLGILWLRLMKHSVLSGQKV